MHQSDFQLSDHADVHLYMLDNPPIEKIVEVIGKSLLCHLKDPVLILDSHSSIDTENNIAALTSVCDKYRIQLKVQSGVSDVCLLYANKDPMVNLDEPQAKIRYSDTYTRLIRIHLNQTPEEDEECREFIRGPYALAWCRAINNGYSLLRTVAEGLKSSWLEYEDPESNVHKGLKINGV